MQCEAMLHNMRGNSRVACIDAQMHQDVFIIGVDIDAKNTENVFSPDDLLPPNQKRGRILGTYNERGRVLHGRQYSRENPHSKGGLQPIA